LVERGDGRARLPELAGYQDLIGQQQEVPVQKSRFQDAEAAVAALGETLRRVRRVVGPSRVLLAVVPLDTHLETEAIVSNRDIGFVHACGAPELKSILLISRVTN
jgi:hemolysin D